MMFMKPSYFELVLYNFKKDKSQDEVLVLTITEDHKIIEHTPIDLFFYTRNRAMIIGYRDGGDWTSKEQMSIRTKKQLYAGWDPVLTVNDLMRMIERKINIEATKRKAYKLDPKKYPFYRMYS